MNCLVYFIPISFDTGLPSLAIIINLQHRSLSSNLYFKFGCEFTNCYGTSNRSLLPVETYDAVVFSSYDLLGDFAVSFFLQLFFFKAYAVF